VVLIAAVTVIGPLGDCYFWGMQQPGGEKIRPWN
jgi:hypothetical protein